MRTVPPSTHCRHRLTGTTGHIAAVTASTALANSPVSGDSGLTSAACARVTVMRGSATMRRIVASTESGDSDGNIRQFTLTRARWGSASPQPPWYYRSSGWC